MIEFVQIPCLQGFSPWCSVKGLVPVNLCFQGVPSLLHIVEPRLLADWRLLHKWLTLKAPSGSVGLEHEYKYQISNLYLYIYV